MIEPQPFWPITAEGWTTIAANVATVLGVVTISIVINLKLSAMVYFQRRTSIAQEMLAQQPRSSQHVDPKNQVINSIYLWAERRQKFHKGLSAEEVAGLPAQERREYILWVSRLVSALDIVVMNDGGVPANIEKSLEQTLAAHASVLETGWPTKRLRFPVSEEMRRLIQRALGRTRI